MVYVIVAIAGISGYLAFQSRNMLLRLGAAIPWLALWNYIANNYANETWTTFATLGCIAISIAIPLSLLEKMIDFKRIPNQGGTIYDKSETGRLEASESESNAGTLNRAFNRFVGNSNSPRRKQTGETAEEYRARARKAVGRDRRRR